MRAELRSGEEFARTLQTIYGDDLQAVLLYGSAARGAYRPGISDLNLLVVLRTLGIAELARGAEATRDWVGAGNPPPLMLGAEEWRSSADVFPLEYSDIRDAHVVLAGEGPFDSMRILRSNLRLQLERELRSKKIQLREGFLVAGEVPSEMGTLLVRALPTFLTLFRGCLRLNARPVPSDDGDLIAAAADLIGFAPDALQTVSAVRSDGQELAAPLDGTVASGYLRAVEAAVDWLDGFVGADLPDEI